MMSKISNKAGRHQSGAVDYSSVTPATGTEFEDRPIADSYANQMPTADTPAEDASARADPDKTIPGPEAASGFDAAMQEHIEKRGKKKS